MNLVFIPIVSLLISLPFTLEFPIHRHKLRQQDWEHSGNVTFERSVLENPDLFEGDILLQPENAWRNAVPVDAMLWTNGVIPYVIDASLNDIKEHIDAAMQHIENYTCIRFKKRTNEEDYVKYFSGNGCFAAAGRVGAQQTVSIGPGCDILGVIIHETVHAIGFYHMHTRSDRDKFLDIFWENIEESLKPQFQLRRPHQNRIFTEFDYDSIMMYGPLTGSKDKHSITMLPKDPNITIIDTHAKTGLSDLDIQAINTLYNCWNVTSKVDNK